MSNQNNTPAKPNSCFTLIVVELINGIEFTTQITFSNVEPKDVKAYLVNNFPKYQTYKIVANR